MALNKALLTVVNIFISRFQTCLHHLLFFKSRKQ